jgi:hypothetical protein
MDIYQKTIVRVLEPAAHWMHESVFPTPPCLTDKAHLVLQHPRWILGSLLFGYPVLHSAGESLVSSALMVNLTLEVQLLGIEVILILVGLAYGLGLGTLLGCSAVFVGELLTF